MSQADYIRMSRLEDEIKELREHLANLRGYIVEVENRLRKQIEDRKGRSSEADQIRKS